MSSRRVGTPIRAALVASLLAGLVSAAPATAGEYTLNACHSDGPNFSSRAFADFATRGMLLKRACNPEGPGVRGLVTQNVVRPGRVPRGSRSNFVMLAAPGTTFKSFLWSGAGRRKDCGYALQMWADGPGVKPVPIAHVRAKRCVPRLLPGPGPGRERGSPPLEKIMTAQWSAKRYSIPGATRIVQRVICLGTPDTPSCSARSRNFLRTADASALVSDPVNPTVSVIADNPFSQGAWVRGSQTVSYTASDNVGVREARAVGGGLEAGISPRPCTYSLPVPCPNGPGAIDVDAGRLAEGTQSLAVRAIDAAGNPTDSSLITVRVDNTAPGAVATSVAGGETWQNRNDFSLNWVNSDEGDRAPIAAAHWRLCRLDGTECSEASRAGAGISALSNIAVSGPGEWHLRLWREDAAGNREAANASVPVTLRFDPEPPELAFEAPNPADPTLMSVAVNDRISGVASGQIELSREGSGVWQVLPTQHEGARLLARIDDASLPPGSYLLRAAARDQASNLNSTDRRAEGTAMAITLPLRTPTVLRAGIPTKVVKRVVRERGRKRRRVPVRETVLAPRAKAKYGDRVRVEGRLLTRDGAPVAGATVQILARTDSGPEQQVAVVATDQSGNYAFETTASASQTLRFAYAGSAQTLPSASEVGLVTTARSTMRRVPRRLLNGQSVHFSGQVRSVPVPAAGKLVEMQVVLSGRWQTFRTVRTDPEGAWRVDYRFRRSCGRVRFRFRARLPAEAGYPFATGRTSPVPVVVRGRPCS